MPLDHTSAPLTAPTPATQPETAVTGLRRGQKARISRISGGLVMTQRMAMLGIRPGVDILAVHGPGKRGAVLQVGGARIALGTEIIENIVVSVGERD
jgi:ferrous iron transport protein A